MSRGSTFSIPTISKEVTTPPPQGTMRPAVMQPVAMQQANHVRTTEPMPVSLIGYVPTQDEIDTTLKLLFWYQERLHRVPVTLPTRRLLGHMQRLMSDIPATVHAMTEELDKLEKPAKEV